MMTIRVRVPETIYQQLSDRAAAEVDTVSHVVRRALVSFLDTTSRRDRASRRDSRAHEGPEETF